MHLVLLFPVGSAKGPQFLKISLLRDSLAVNLRNTSEPVIQRDYGSTQSYVMQSSDESDDLVPSEYSWPLC